MEEVSDTEEYPPTLAELYERAKRTVQRFPLQHEARRQLTLTILDRDTMSRPGLKIALQLWLLTWEFIDYTEGL